MFKRNNAASSPQAIGVGSNVAQQAVALPILVGRAQVSPKIIYRGNEQAANGSMKKGKSGKKSGGIQSYRADFDMLLATCGFGRTQEGQLTAQGLQAILSIWSDKQNFPVSLASWTGTVASGSVTIAVPGGGFLIQIIGVTANIPYAATFSDYGAGAPVSVSGNFDKPLWNTAFHYYDPSSYTPLPGSSRTPYTYTAPASVAASTTIAIDPGLNGKTVTVYFAYVSDASKAPLTQVNQVFESFLGSSHTVAQPITYQDCGGVAGAQIDEGMLGGTPNYRYGAMGWGGISPSGDANPADFLALVFNGPHGMNMSSLLQQLQGPTSILGDLSGMRDYCDANGIWISPYLDQQRSGTDLIKDLLDISNCYGYWSEGVFKIVPRSELSQVGNGAVYTSPTQTPVAIIGPEDYVCKPGALPVQITRTKNASMKNVLPVQFKNREIDYADDSVTAVEGCSVSENGPQLASGTTFDWIKEKSVAAAVGTPMVKRMARGEGLVIAFVLQPTWQHLECTDFVLLNEPSSDLTNYPAILSKADVQPDGSVQCEAIPYFYMSNAPFTPPASQDASPGTVYTNVDPGAVGIWYIFEPVLRASGTALPELWIAAAGDSQYYGDCEVLISIDGGGSYESLGRLGGRSIIGTVSSTWTAGSDPDTTHDLSIDLTASRGTLQNWPQSATDSFVPLCVVEGGAGSIPYELIAYDTAQLTAANQYTLKATGTGNELRRGVYGCPVLGAGVAHAVGKKFVSLLGPLMKIALDPKLIGTTLYLKFLALNIYGQNEQLESAVTPVAYTVTGVAASQVNLSYTISPAQPLSQAASTYSVVMAQCTAAFSTGIATNYNARIFAVSDPGAGLTQQYWVTIYDPNLLGDTGSGTTRTAYCDTNKTRWNSPGYVRIGSIVVTHAGGTAGGGGGTAMSTLQQLTVTDSGDHQHFSLNTDVSVLLLFIDGQKVNSADITLSGSSVTLAAPIDPQSHVEAYGA